MNNKIRNEIQNLFALSNRHGAYRINTIDSRNKAWVRRKGEEYSVFIEYKGKPISESFAGASMYSEVANVEGEGDINILLLSATDKYLRNEFALICEDFINPGENGEKRKQLTDNPIKWWEKWKSLLGNAQSDKMVYDIIGELSALVKLYELGEKPTWSASKLGSHDIELTSKSFEVKSTIKKESSIIHVSSQFQLDSDKPLYLVFTRLEESQTGKSIDDILNEIEKFDTNMVGKCNQYLNEKGFRKGNHSRTSKKYVILERRKYTVDDDFPKITANQFKDDKFPDNISHIEYDLSLDGLDYENWK